jgi:hypothetical protein
VIFHPGSPSAQLGTASFIPLPAKPGHHPLSMPGHRGLALASPSLQAPTLSSPTRPWVLETCQLLPKSVQSAPCLSQGSYTSSYTTGRATVTSSGPQMSPSQGDNFIFSVVGVMTASPCHQHKHQVLQSCQALMAHICNPSYLGSWDGEDRGSRSVWKNSLRDHSSPK